MTAPAARSGNRSERTRHFTTDGVVIRTSNSNLLQAFHSLNKRHPWYPSDFFTHDMKRTILYGVNPVKEALKAGRPLERLLVAQERKQALRLLYPRAGDSPLLLRRP